MVLLGLAGLVGCAAGEARVGTKVPLKLKDPKEAALTYVQAVGYGDIATARAACLGTERQKRWTTITATFTDGLISYDAAILKRFGSAALAAHMDIVNALNPLTTEPRDAINNAEVRIEENEAMLETAVKKDDHFGHPKRVQMAHASILKQVGPVWKVDLPRLQEERPELKAENESADLDRLVRLGTVMKRVAADVTRKKIKTLAEAQQAIADGIGG